MVGEGKAVVVPCTLSLNVWRHSVMIYCLVDVVLISIGCSLFFADRFSSSLFRTHFGGEQK